MSFYRTYRPTVIDEIDNGSVSALLRTYITKEKAKLPHAYLLSGPRGAGKTTAARILAKIFICSQASTKDGPCGVCDQCRSVAQGRNLDILEIDAASNRGIDDMRTLRESIALAPTSSAYKIYIIDEVHMLTTEAFNALLKTLEEPPAHAIFVLATTDISKVPVTIQSRCVTIVFERAKNEEIEQALLRIIKKEKLSIDAEALAILVDRADGSFRDAVKHLEQVSFHSGPITPDVVRSTLSLTDDAVTDAFLSHLREHNVKDAMNLIGTLVEKGSDMKDFLVTCLHALEARLVKSARGERIDDGWELSELTNAIAVCSHAYVEMKTGAIPQLPLELAVVELCRARVIPSESVRVSPAQPPKNEAPDLGLLTLEKLETHWKDFIDEMNPYNHSIAGVLRSSRPKSVEHGIVTIEAFYTFHKDKLLEGKTRDTISLVLKKLFGENVKVEIVLGKK
ncbi:MAG: DNA polymerase III subunit gamma/tau [bacterium]|nr:DNA polymerase III subunit gamma/tau [bacterium]